MAHLGSGPGVPIPKRVTWGIGQSPQASVSLSVGWAQEKLVPRVVVVRLKRIFQVFRAVMGRVKAQQTRAVILVVTDFVPLAAPSIPKCPPSSGVRGSSSLLPSRWVGGIPDGRTSPRHPPQGLWLLNS